MDNTKEYILCAAIRRKEPRASSGVPYHKSDILDVELGYRHHDIYQRFEGELSLEMKDQGFYTSYNRFVGRKEAMKIAYEAGQVPKERAFNGPWEDGPLGNMEKPKGYVEGDFSILTSEDLY